MALIAGVLTAWRLRQTPLAASGETMKDLGESWSSPGFVDT
jgi:hypothetical protein